MSIAGFTQPTPWDGTTAIQQCGVAILFGFTAIALVVSCLRTYSRFVRKTFGLDDLLIIIAMVISIGHTGASYICIKYAYIGFSTKQIPRYNPEVMLMWMYIVTVLYSPILSIVKISILIFLLRLGGYKTGVRNTIMGVGSVVLVIMVGSLIAAVFQCLPLEYNWRPWAVKGTCINKKAYYAVIACLNVATDLMGLVVPVMIFWDLKMNKKLKWSLIFVFMLGFITTIVGCIRLGLLLMSHYLQSPEIEPRSDWAFSVCFTVSAIEVNIAIWMACLPALWPLGRRWFPGIYSRMGLASPQQARFDHEQVPFSLSEGGSSGDFRRSSVTDPVAAYRERFLKDGQQRMRVAPFLSVSDENGTNAGRCEL